MPDIVRLSVLPGVNLTAYTTDRFKTSMLTLSLVRPLSREEASLSALLPRVLCRGTKTYPDMTALAARLETLYGARLEPSVRKKGETQCVGLSASFVDGAFLPGHPDQLRDMAALMGDVLLSPAGNGGFFPETVAGERTLLVDQIRALKNEKSAYAAQRLLEFMCDTEPYGIHQLGREASAAAVTPEALWVHYHRLLARSRAELFYIGPQSPRDAAAALREALSSLPRADTFDESGTRVVRSAGPLRRFEETMDVAQGKLAMGMRMGVSAADPDYPAALLCTAVYGGTTASKLFTHVRERLQLCYYASAWLEGHKGILVVSSGIEPDSRAAAEREIFDQWDAMRRGDVTQEEVAAARLSLVSRLRAMNDQPHRLEDYLLGQASAGLSGTPDMLADSLETLDAAALSSVAARASWDTVYFLRGEEETV